MGTLAEKLDYLSDTKDAIKEALIEKGVTVSDNDTFRSYADKIDNLSSDDYVGFNSETVPYIYDVNNLYTIANNSDTGTITFPSGSNFFIDTKDYTVEFCVFLTGVQAPSSGGRFFELGTVSGSSSSTFGINTYRDNNNNYVLEIGYRDSNATLEWHPTTCILQLDTLYTISAVIDDTNSKFSVYVNGELVVEYTNINLYYLTSYNHSLQIKYGATSGRKLYGTGYMLRLYGKVLSAQEILHNYQIDYNKFANPSS